MASVADIRTYVYGATYDSWNRVQTMTYPDGEVVTYHYNAAGQVESLTSNKQGRQSVIVDRIGYEKEGHTVSCWLTSIVLMKTCPTSSTASSLMMKLACAIMVQGT
jgi:putative YD repeat protein (fragment)